MSEIERYDLHVGFGTDQYLTEDDNGHYVLYSAYEELKAENKKLKKGLFLCYYKHNITGKQLEELHEIASELTLKPKN